MHWIQEGDTAAIATVQLAQSLIVTLWQYNIVSSDSGVCGGRLRDIIVAFLFTYSMPQDRAIWCSNTFLWDLHKHELESARSLYDIGFGDDEGCDLLGFIHSCVDRNLPWAPEGGWRDSAWVCTEYLGGQARQVGRATALLGSRCKWASKNGTGIECPRGLT